LFIQTDKVFDTAVTRDLSIFWKITGREFTQTPVVLNTFTAYAFLAAGEGTIAKPAV
jgi:hypothetical protein